MKKWLLLTAALFLGVVGVRAETPEEVASRHGVNFPIAELGNCGDYSVCRSYCEDTGHYEACVAFAKKKGFYEERGGGKQEILDSARRELGCTTYEGCRDFCSEVKNYDRCNSFAQKHQVGGGYETDPRGEEILEKAKQFLGCTNYETCMEFCNEAQNYEKCSQFAAAVGIAGGQQVVGPGGCTTEATCRELCARAENYQICAQYAGATDQQYTGPGGCDSEESCRQYCEGRPGECSWEGGTGPDPVEMCSKTPDCTWANGVCQCTKMEGMTPDEYCRKYPDRCSNSGQTAPAIPPTDFDPDEYCRQYPDKCQGYQNQTDFAAQCQTKAGCSWDAASKICSCQVQNATGCPEGQIGDGSGGCRPEEVSREGGETVTESQCLGAGCNWVSNTCQCPDTKGETQGVATERGWGGKLGEWGEILWDNLRFLLR